MTKQTDADPTLPSVAGALPGGHRREDPVLTVIFHPVGARIGESVLVPRQPAGSPYIIGRNSPTFGRRGAQQRQPLAELHLSRRALALSGSGKTLTIQRLPGSSRCRVGGVELHASRELQPEELRRGVPILMGHCVVLLLRLAPRLPRAEVAIAAGDLCGSGASTLALREQIRQVAADKLDVLILGETGTGKELVARAIHAASARAAGPLVSVNMAAIVPGLAAASLFGNARGAFTGASAASDGYFVQAQGGSLFLDEIGDTPPEVQPQLLRALEQREIQPIGGPIRRVDVRVISATDAAVEGEASPFKSALRHRLGAHDVLLAPLREHPEDIGELAWHYLHRAVAESGSGARLPAEDAPQAELAAWAELFHSFLCFHWPGNVRQLVNFTRQVVLASRDQLTLPDSVSRSLREQPPPQETSRQGEHRPRRRRMADVSETEFDRAMEANDHEPASVARQLEVSRQAVYRRMGESNRYRLAGQIPEAELAAALEQSGGDARVAARQLRVSVVGLRARLRNSGLAWS